MPPDATGAPVPRAGDLEAMPADDWARLLRHVRAALHALDDTLLNPRLVQLRAVPAGRLAGGRSRRDLCRALARGGPLWRETASRLRDDPDAAQRLGWLLAGGSPPATAEPERSPPEPSGTSEREQRLADRVRELLEERDDARRRADGLDARLGTERAHAAELAEQVERLRTRVTELERAVADAATEREAAVDRARRQSASELADVREELRSLRRREHEREERRRREEEAAAAAERRAERLAAEREKVRDDGRAGVPARPTVLPPGVAPETTEAATHLLTAGRSVLVDGYNVTKQHRGQLSLEQQRRWLIATLESLVARTGIDAAIVFDGDPTTGIPSTTSRSVRVAFTAGQTADDAIVDLAAGLPADEPLLVVTDDRELRSRLERHRVDVLGTTPFLGAVS